MSGTREGGVKAAASITFEMRQEMGRKGGQSSRGYPFAHGLLDPHEVGKLGGRPRGVTLYKAEDKGMYKVRLLKLCDHCKKRPDGSVKCTRPGVTGSNIVKLHRVVK